MGSSSNRSFGYERHSSSEIFDKIRNAENEAKVQQYEVDVNSEIDNVLSTYNNRDTEAIQQHINSVKSALNKDIEGTVSTRFGGSLSKNTHLAGLSDVDTLVLLNDSGLPDKAPSEVLDYFYKRLKDRFPQVELKKGDTAVTIHFKDGDLQLLPAIRYKTGLKIPDGNEWSPIIKPTLFARRLTILNQKLNNRLIPAIKIIKGIISKFPENARLTGYHIESLALQIFESKYKSLQGAIKNKELIKSFFKEAAYDIRNPIKDVTKQSKNVDDYLGDKKNLKRLLVSDVLERTYRRLEMADSSRILDIWKEIIKIN